MTVLQKLLKAFGFEVSDEQAEILEDAISKDKEVVKEEVKQEEKEVKEESKDSVEVKALREELAALKATLDAKVKESSIDSLLDGSKDKEVVKALLKGSENLEEDLKTLKSSKPFLFEELPSITGSEDVKTVTEFERLYNEKYLKK